MSDTNFDNNIGDAAGKAHDAIDNAPIDNSTVKNAAHDVVDSTAHAATKTAGFDPIAMIHRVGFRSSFAYIGGFASIVIALVAWLASRGNPSDDKAQSDRWGIFIGHWAPTFFAIGIALKKEEDA